MLLKFDYDKNKRSPCGTCFYPNFRPGPDNRIVNRVKQVRRTTLFWLLPLQVATNLVVAQDVILRCAAPWATRPHQPSNSQTQPRQSLLVASALRAPVDPETAQPNRANIDRRSASR